MFSKGACKVLISWSTLPERERCVRFKIVLLPFSFAVSRPSVYSFIVSKINKMRRRIGRAGRRWMRRRCLIALDTTRFSWQHVVAFTETRHSSLRRIVVGIERSDFKEYNGS
jgi:hypothetical protein